MNRDSWLDRLATEIETAQDGDIIVVKSEDAKELGERAATRMRPGADLVFVVEVNDVW